MPQILGHLTLVVLLLKIHLNSSASLLSMESLTHEKSSMHTTGGNITSFATLKGSLLTGFYTEIFYTDTTCSAVEFGESYPLNACVPWIDGYSIYATTNGTHIAYKVYSDYSCATLTRSLLYNQPVRTCGKYSATVSVTASYPTIVSSAALLTAS
jgi:hypothetical protein